MHRTSERFRALVAEKTSGQVIIDIKPNSSLFNLRSGTEALRLGTTDLHWSDLGTLGNWRPELGFISLPFIFTGFDHVKRVIYGPVGEQVKADVKSALGLEMLSFGASGFRVFLGNKPVRTADDCRGMKLRVPEAPVWIEMARALGCQPHAHSGRWRLYRAADPYRGRDGGAARLHGRQQAVRNRAQRDAHQPHLHRSDLLTSVRKMASLPADVQAALRESARQAIEVEMWAENLTRPGRRLGRRWRRTPTAISAPDLQQLPGQDQAGFGRFRQPNTRRRTEYLEGVAAAAA